MSLKYEDKDGDYIILASQNDFNDLFIFSDSDTFSVMVSESVSLPNVNRKSTTIKPTTGVFNTVQNSQSWNRNSAGPAGLSGKLERFPIISDSSSALFRQESYGIRWKKAEMLGQGAFGVVYLGLNIDTGELMAVKQMATEEVSKKELATLDNEINLLRTLRHPNIVRYIGTELTSTALSIFLEYVPGGSLKALIDKFGHLEESVARSYTRQLLIGLECLHRNGIAHRDIKGANCLVGNDGVIKLADFGSSKYWRPPTASGSLSNTQGRQTHLSTGPTGDIKGKCTGELLYVSTSNGCVCIS